MSGHVEVLALDPRLLKFIATRDRRMAKTQPWSPTPLLNSFIELVSRGYTKVGGRASCGGATDPTWLEFTLWNEVVRKARALGYEIEVTAIKHGNAWATKCGGFWNENEYRCAARMTFLHACLAYPYITFAVVVTLLSPLADYLPRKETK